MEKSPCENCPRNTYCSKMCDKWTNWFKNEWDKIREAANKRRKHQEADE